MLPTLLLSGKPCLPPPPPREKPPKTAPSPFPPCTLVTAETGSSLSVASRGGQGFSFELAWPQARCLTSSLLN
ncbi:uncharacterized protein BDW47DRAFT_121194 [Aspergillus candidus]|uniref:Uncharacterized protein n=1 Tax=Aspergillus candidus TaxID=41067 RepID=A0A2I2EYI7_ASPCN|nr:hypothetical protein BDW47DRAFT_121194 [Aspergillus candidus]PLB33447.1 hypothetical protein BDW47DRAFT_121194 [Aspergillus candidus]